MLSIIKMQFRTTIKNPAILFIIIFPLIMITVLGSVFTAADTSVSSELIMKMVMGNVIVLTVMSSISNNFGSNFMELKQSVIIKRLGSTEISKAGAMIGFMLWAVILSLFTIGYTMALVALFTDATKWLAPSAGWDTINWVGFFYGVVMLIIISFTMTFMFISISPNNESFQILSFFYFFLVLYFGGLIFPTASIPWMNGISLLLPHTYIAHFLQGAFNDGMYQPFMNNSNLVPSESIWSFKNWSDVYVMNGTSSLNLIMPIVFAILTGVFASRNFKWDSN